MSDEGDLFASYVCGYADADGLGPSELAFHSPLSEWAAALGRLDARARRMPRTSGQVQTWAACWETYGRALCAGGEDGGAVGPPVNELVRLIALQDRRNGRQRTPVELATLLRGLGS